jgi:hypothetical protein
VGEASLDQGNPPRDIEHRSEYSILPKVRLHPVADVSLELRDFSLHGPQALALNQAAPQVRPFIRRAFARQRKPHIALSRPPSLC